MTDLLEVVSRLEEAGGKLTLDGGRVRYCVPSGDSDTRRLLNQLRQRRDEVARILRARTIIPAMPPGMRLVGWNLKQPPVAIESCAVVTDPLLFANTTLLQLRIALAEPRRWVGWTVPQMVDRLAQVGVIVALEDGKGAIA